MEETLTTSECMKILRITRPTILKLIKDKRPKPNIRDTNRNKD